MAAEITNSEDIINSREVIDRIEELISDLDTCRYCTEEIRMTDNPNAEEYEATEDSLPHICPVAPDHLHCPVSEYPEDDREELRILRDLADDGETNCSDWSEGITLIRESYAKEYVQDNAEDFSGLRFTDWPLNCIDWEEAAEKWFDGHDEIKFDGVTYYAS